VALLLGWQEAPVGVDGAPAKAPEPEDPARSSTKAGTKPDPTRDLPEADRVLFQTLRRWRGEVAREEGVPAYVVLTNRELLSVVQRKPTSKNALSNLPGIGAGKVKRYGDRLLRALAGATEASRDDAGAQEATGGQDEERADAAGSTDAAEGSDSLQHEALRTSERGS